ncbi:hypothetical protein CsSME_00010409 [Camellia sinensis var. sinensis]
MEVINRIIQLNCNGRRYPVRVREAMEFPYNGMGSSRMSDEVKVVTTTELEQSSINGGVVVGGEGREVANIGAKVVPKGQVANMDLVKVAKHAMEVANMNVVLTGVGICNDGVFESTIKESELEVGTVSRDGYLNEKEVGIGEKSWVEKSGRSQRVDRDIVT